MQMKSSQCGELASGSQLATNEMGGLSCHYGCSADTLDSSRAVQHRVSHARAQVISQQQ